MADRDAVARQHLREQGRRPGVAAQQDRDVARLDPVAHQLEHLGADELGLGALAARLEQADGAVGRAPGAPGLEQGALEVMQRRAGGRRVVLRALGQVDDVGERAQLLDRRGAAGEGDAAGLVGQRHDHVRRAVAGQRLDRVALRRGEVVEAVEEDRAPAPRRRRGPERVERRPGVALPVGPAQLLEPAPVGRVERGELAGVRRAPRPTPAAPT